MTHFFHALSLRQDRKGYYRKLCKIFFFFKKETYNVLTNITITPLRKVGTPAHYYLLRYNVHSLNFFLVRKKMQFYHQNIGGKSILQKMKEKSLLFLTKTPDLWRHSSKFGNSEVRKSFVIGCSPIRAFQPSQKKPFFIR